MERYVVGKSDDRDDPEDEDDFAEYFYHRMSVCVDSTLSKEEYKSKFEKI